MTGGAQTWTHTTVLLHEAVDALVQSADGVYVDGTFGRGGHARAILARLSSHGRLFAFDKDPQAIAAGAQLGDARLQLLHASFADMREQLAPHGVTVNLVAPGTILTDLNRAAMADDDWRAAKQRLIPAGRLGAPADIGAVAAFLASDAAGYVTGATLVADGGLTLGVQP